MKAVDDGKPFHRLGSFTNDYHVQYRRKQYEKHMRDTFRKDPEKWRCMMRNKLHRKPR